MIAAVSALIRRAERKWRYAFFKKQLTVLGKMHCNGKPIKSINVISWHPRSLTWSWSVTWSPDYIRNGLPFYYMRYGGYKAQGWYFMCGLKLPLFGHIKFSNQPTMPIKKYVTA